MADKPAEQTELPVHFRLAGAAIASTLVCGAKWHGSRVTSDPDQVTCDGCKGK